MATLLNVLGRKDGITLGERDAFLRENCDREKQEDIEGSYSSASNAVVEEVDAHIPSLHPAAHENKFGFLMSHEALFD